MMTFGSQPEKEMQTCLHSCSLQTQPTRSWKLSPGLSLRAPFPFRAVAFAVGCCKGYCKLTSLLCSQAD